MPENAQKSKRGRSDDEESAETALSNNIVSLLEGLSNKMDVLNATVSDNSNAIKDIDSRLTAKIDNLEATVADNINRVKIEMDSRMNLLTSEVNDRLDLLENKAQASCRETVMVRDDTVAKIDGLQCNTEARFNKLERELLRNELVVTGVPACYGERVFDIIGDICAALQSNVNGVDIVAAYRLPSSKSHTGRNHNGRQPAISSPIILKMGNDWAKQDLLSAYFKKKTLNTGDIGFQSRARIYLNESLTKHDRAVFKAATEAKKSRSIVKCYTRNGTVHVQLHEDGKIFRISCIDHLNAIILNEPSKPKPNGTLMTSSALTTSKSTTATSTSIPIGSSLATSSQQSTPSINSTPSTIAELQTKSTTNPGFKTSVHNGDLVDQ